VAQKISMGRCDLQHWSCSMQQMLYVTHGGSLSLHCSAVYSTASLQQVTAAVDAACWCCLPSCLVYGGLEFVAVVAAASCSTLFMGLRIAAGIPLVVVLCGGLTWLDLRVCVDSWHARW
jgi:hypothetical protein